MATPKNKLIHSTWLIDRINIFFRLRQYLRWVSERWFILLVCLIVSGGVAAYRAINTPNIYRAFSKISIAPRIQTPNASQSQYLEALNNYYDSQIEFMRSGAVLGKTQLKTREQRPADPKFELTPRAIKGPASFTLEVDSTHLDFAKLFAKTWAREFIAFKDEMKDAAVSRTALSTREEIKRYEVALEKARADLLAFQRTHNIGSIKETGAAAQSRLDKYEAEYQDIKALRQRLETRKAEDLANNGEIDQLRPFTLNTTSQESTAPIGTAADPLARFESGKYGELKINLRSRQADFERELSRLKPGHPHMRMLKRQIDQYTRELTYQLELIEEKRLARINALKNDETGYVPIIDQLRKQVLASQDIQYQFTRLRDEEAALKQALDTHRRTEQSLSSTTIDETAFNILEEGVGSPVPVRPNRVKMIFEGLIIGLAAGLGLIYFLGKLDDRAELAEEVERHLNTRILGQVPFVNLKESKQERVLITNLDKHSMFAEALRGVRSALFLGIPEIDKKQVLIVSSAAPGEGKTTITFNFALTLALAGHKVLLVDGDLRRGNVHNYLQVPRDNGFAEVLQGQAELSDVLQDTPLDNLKAITSGKLPSNPGELLIGPIVGKFIDEARKQFDFVVFDCPPLTAIDDTFSLANLADGLLFVVMSGQTSMRFAKSSLSAVAQRGATILGVILNGIKPNNPYHYYQQYYYTYYNSEEATTPAKRVPAKSSVKTSDAEIKG